MVRGRRRKTLRLCLMIGYFGPEGTFTHQALLTLGEQDGWRDFIDPTDVKPYATVQRALDAVREGEVEASLVPIENSVEGGVSATLDYLARPGADQLQIKAEVVIAVEFELVARPGTTLDQVKTIITHPHAAAQCRDWVAENVPGAVIVEKGSTAAAALEVSNPDSEFDAAISAAVARDLYGLVSLASGISDNEAAETRFILATRAGKPTERTGADKTTLVAFMRVDRSGALLEILQQFAVRGVNLCRIESRPTKTMLGSYCFSIDAEGHISDLRLAETLQGLKRVCKDVTYARADKQPPIVPRGQTDDDYADSADWFSKLS